MEVDREVEVDPDVDVDVDAAADEMEAMREFPLLLLGPFIPRLLAEPEEEAVAAVDMICFLRGLSNYLYLSTY